MVNATPAGPITDYLGYAGSVILQHLVEAVVRSPELKNKECRCAARQEWRAQKHREYVLDRLPQKICTTLFGGTVFRSAVQVDAQGSPRQCAHLADMHLMCSAGRAHRLRSSGVPVPAIKPLRVATMQKAHCCKELPRMQGWLLAARERVTYSRRIDDVQSRCGRVGHTCQT